MRTTFSLALLASLVAAGCLGEPVPMIEPTKSYASSACAVGSFVTGFDAEGAPLCAAAPALAAAECDEAEVMVGIAPDGTPRCAPIMEVAQEAAEKEAAQRPEASRPAKTLSLTSNGPLQDGQKAYTVASASSGLRWGELHFTLDGVSLRAASSCAPAAGEYARCANGVMEAESAAVDPGDSLVVHARSGETLRILDANANAVILTLTVG